MKIKISKSQWEEMGRQAGWINKKAWFGVSSLLANAHKMLEEWYEEKFANQKDRKDPAVQMDFAQRLNQAFPKLPEQTVKDIVADWADNMRIKLSKSNTKNVKGHK